LTQDFSDKSLENKIEALHRKLEFELEHDLRPEKETGRHPAEIALIGASLILLSGLLDEGAFFGIYLIGAVLTVIDLPKLIGEEQNKILKALKGKPLPYLAAGLATSIILQASGNHVPPPELGLLAEITVSITELILNVI